MPSDAPTNEFIPAAKLAALSGYQLKSIYNQHVTGRGCLAPILTKLGSRVGCWRADWDAFADSQRKLPPAQDKVA